ncbi:MAG TPA: prolipoprotein diacylglyceryl transferase [Mycobacterium sp.]|uniref:prolipoprotein diacylglyceryl transferase n=1 Tax=Mycobacterium sp. TaxID=1785 RepID=UPI002D505230|nr:prolipoprotein diacylglyceryl transferase [Mycobacterium sp.]HZU46906.1 prolipoprotein diacylglyceryl transferase [Mycobacterium sp.]
MTTILAYFPSPPRGVWHLGPIPIRAYALFIIVGIVVALLIGDRRWEERGGERGVIYDVALWAVPFGLIGGRLYHLITDWRTYFGGGGAGWGAALRIWDGGLGIWGAVALGGVGAWIACRRRGIPLPAFADAVAPGIVLAQAIGRLGNYFNQELFGRETTLPWGMEVFYRRDPAGFVDVHSLDGVSTGQLAMVVQPTFLYEMLWDILIFAALIYLDRRFTIGHGRLFALYVAGYCIGRFCIELLRDDPATHIAGIRVNLFTSTFVFIGAVIYLMAAPKGREDPATLGGAARVEEAPAPEPATELAAVASATGAGDAAKLSGQGGDGLVESAETEEAAEAAEAHEVEEAAEAAEVEEPEVEEPEPQEAEEAEGEPAEAEKAGVDAAEPEATAEPEVSEEEEAEPEPAEAAAEAEEEAEAEAEEPEPEKPEEAQPEEVAEAEEAEPKPETATHTPAPVTADLRITRWTSRLRTLRRPRRGSTDGP